jgi:hypothetical protein
MSNFITSQINKAAEIRNEISNHYKEYKNVTDLITFASGISHNDFKKSVDAIHYLGGRFPSPNSKGRLESLLDDLVGIVKVLKFIDMDSCINEHLSQYGISISIKPEHEIKDFKLSNDDIKYIKSVCHKFSDCKTLKELFISAFSECDNIQTTICTKADTIKLDIKQTVMTNTHIESHEFSRLIDFTKKVKLDKEHKADETHINNVKSMNEYGKIIQEIRNG